MKPITAFFIALLIVIACVHQWFVPTGMAAFDIAIIIALLFAVSYLTQFPFSSRTFTVSGTGDKVLSFMVIAFMNMIAIFIVPALAAYAFRLYLGQLLGLYLLFFGIFYMVGGRQDPSFKKDKDKINNSSVLNFLFWSSIIVTVIMGLYYGCWMSGDYTWHATYIRKLREIAPIAYRNYLLADLPYPQYGHNIWHLFMALLSYMSRQDVAFVWINSNIYLPIVFVACFYVLSKELFKSGYWGKVSTIIFIMYVAFLGIELGGADIPLIEHKWSLDTSPYPSIVTRYAMLTAFYYYLIKSLNEKKMYVREIAFASLCVALAHFYYVTHMVFVGFTTFAGLVCITGNDKAVYRKLLLQYAVILIPVIAYLVYYKQLLDSPTINPWFLSVAGMGDVYRRVRTLGNGWPYIHPWWGFLRNPYFAVATLTFIPLTLSLFGKNRSVWKMFLTLPVVALAAVFFNPPVLEVLKKINPGLDRVWRMVEIIPVTLLLAGFVYYLQEEKGWLKKTIIPWLLCGTIAGLFPIFIKYHSDIRYTASLWEQTASQHVQYKEIVEKYVPPGSNIFPDPKIAWTWTTIFPHFIYIHPFPAGLPPKFDPTPRLTLWKSFFEKDISQSMIDDMREKNIDYLVLHMDTFAAKKQQMLRFKEDFGEPQIIQQMGLVVIKLLPVVKK
jgi:hypothetical protein